MSTHWFFYRLALASTMVLAACSSDTPTSPTASSQALAVAAPTIVIWTPYYIRSLCYPARLYSVPRMPLRWDRDHQQWRGWHAQLDIQQKRDLAQEIPGFRHRTVEHEGLG
jgi:hypothetical protein